MPIIELPDNRSEELLRLGKEIADLAQKLAERVTALASTILAFSVTFRGSIAGDHPTSLWLLQASWFMLVFTIAGCLAFAYMPIALRQESINRIMKNPVAQATLGPSAMFRRLFRASLGAFALALLALVIFAIRNTR